MHKPRMNRRSFYAERDRDDPTMHHHHTDLISSIATKHNQTTLMSSSPSSSMSMSSSSSSPSSSTNIFHNSNIGSINLEDYITAMEARSKALDRQQSEVDVWAQLQQKESDILLAAELGKALLEKNEELVKQHEKLIEDYSTKIENAAAYSSSPNIKPNINTDIQMLWDGGSRLPACCGDEGSNKIYHDLIVGAYHRIARSR
ncbi:bicaudal D-related protein homolog [Anastrepha obliqua]|uniref:bicaudal D-related protein homolog n=1 Tax=Anastrepha obliqua TaxID=95512 RepID=UPI00240959FE|nr:bicaudal D-related protein homolog [Anastrepha obliqua]